MRILAIATAVGVISSLAAPAAFGKDYFAGKTITVLVGSSAGGGYDTYARAVARHLGQHIPGHPDIVVRNQAGAGSGAAAAMIFKTAPKDGTWIGAIFPGIMMHPILDTKSPLKFEPKEFKFLGSADNSTRICITRQNSKTKTFEDAQKRQTVIGASAAGGSTRDYAYMLNNVAGAKFKVVSGYKGSAQLFLAIERGEIEGMCGIDWASLRAQRPAWVKDKTVNILIETALEPSPDLKAMGVPTMWKYVKDEKDRKAAELIVSQQVFGRPYVMAPETPENVVEILRKALMETLNDEAFKADAKKVNIDVSPVSGERVQKLVSKLYTAPPEVAHRARDIIEP